MNRYMTPHLSFLSASCHFSYFYHHHGHYQAWAVFALLWYFFSHFQYLSAFSIWFYFSRLAYFSGYSLRYGGIALLSEPHWIMHGCRWHNYCRLNAARRKPTVKTNSRWLFCWVLRPFIIPPSFLQCQRQRRLIFHSAARNNAQKCTPRSIMARLNLISSADYMIFSSPRHPLIRQV